MKNTLYLECYSGISGDMTVGALIDLGADVDVLFKGLNSLNVDGYKIEIGRKENSGLDTCDFHVILDIPETDYRVEETHPHVHFHQGEEFHSHSHSHQEEELHSHSHPHQNEELHTHDHSHQEEELHFHDHSHQNGKSHTHLHYGHHEHRNLDDINSIIENSSISMKAKEIAKKIFYIIAVAEATAHGKSIEEVHFHEVGAVDSIIDITATAICLDNLGIEEVIVSELYEGSGHIKCQHGILPVPVPAVVNIAAKHHLPLHITSVNGELVTPTGAAIAAAIKTLDTLPKKFKINKIGLGCGKRDYGRISFLRAMLIEDTTKVFNTSFDKAWVLEANIDDCSGEALSLAMDKLFQKGAKDVYYTPIFMKKNRPAYLLGVICKEEDIEALEEIIFTHTTTIGIRKHETIRTILDRSFKTVETPYGEAVVKICTYKDKVFYYPESDSIKKLSAISGEDYASLYNLIWQLARS